MYFFSVLNLLTLFFTLVTTTALAAPVFSSKDWILEDTGTYCVASTSMNFEGQSYRFEAALEKSGRYPVEFYIRPATENTATLAFTAPLDERRKIIYSLTRLPQANGTPDVFWMIPRATDSFVTFIRQASALPIRRVEATANKAFNFSLAGSTATMEQLQQRCHPKKNIDILYFEKVFLPNLVTTVDPKKVVPDHTLALRNSYLAGFQAYHSKTSAETELNQLRQNFAKQTKELEEVQKIIAKLEGKDLPPLTAKRTELETKIRQTESQIAQKQQGIEEQKQLRTPAAADLAQAEGVVAPYMPEFNRRSSLVESARNSLNRAKTRLNQIDSRVSQLESEINSLNSELTRLRSQISSKRSELSSAESSYRDAQRDNDRFNESSEYQDRLRRDSRYNSTKWDVEQTARNLQTKQGERNRARSEVDRKRAELRQCQAQAGANCTAQQGALSRAESALRSLDSEISSLEWNLRSKQDDLRRIESRIADSVRSEKENLERREDDARRRYDSTRSDLAQLESRASNISQFDIPNRQNELSGLRSERPVVNQEIRAAELDLSQRQAELETWMNSVDFSTKYAAYTKARDLVAAIDGQIANLEREKSRLTTTLDSTRAELVKVVAAQDKVKAEITKYQIRRSELEAALAGFNKEQERLNKDIQTATGLFDQSKKDFLSALPN